MGSASSQIVRRAVKPTEIGTFKPCKPSSPGDSCYVRHDDQDLRFIANIKHLGPVHVSKHPTSKLPHRPARIVFESHVPNPSIGQSVLVLPVHRLHELLDRRKDAASPSCLASLVENYGMNQKLLDQLVGVINSPSVRADASVRFIHTDTGEETPSAIALWVNPRFDKSL